MYMKNMSPGTSNIHQFAHEPYAVLQTMQGPANYAKVWIIQCDKMHCKATLKVFRNKWHNGMHTYTYGR